MSAFTTIAGPEFAAVLADPAAAGLGATLRVGLLHAAEGLPAAPASSIARARATLAVLAQLGGDGEMLSAALLVDWPGLADAFKGSLQRDFPAVAHLVEGQRAAGPVWALHAQQHAARSSEGLRRLLLAMVRDLRVVPILLARQLVAMRGAHVLPAHERHELALLTRDIHAPLANRLGIWQLKWELEDLAFRHLQPDTYQQIARLLDEKRDKREAYVEHVKTVLRGALAAQGIRADVAGRPKHIFSIWKKMQRKGVPIGELYDLRAVRVLVDDVAACYAALGVVHAAWVPVASEFDDYIARPKRNDYRSLHTAVIGPEGKTLEVQIRTHDMHRQAELGVAAHWKYKEGGGHGASSPTAAAAFERKIAWMRRLLETTGEAGHEGALAGEFSSELVEDRIYVLTPKGEVVDLPVGATPLDFAYHVHTDLGHRCRGAKIDGRIVPLDHRLCSGDYVEILTGKVSEPRRDWLLASNGFLASARSREKVRNWFNRLDRGRNEQAGRELLEKELRRQSLLKVDLAPARERFRVASDEELFVHVALGDVGPHQVTRALLDHQRALASTNSLSKIADASALAATPRLPRSDARGAGDVTVEGVGNLLVQIARCCQPLPGEPIVGYLTRSRGVSVHRPTCATYARLTAVQSERAVPVEWSRARAGYEVDLDVLAFDDKWLLKEVTNLAAQANITVLSLVAGPGRGSGRTRLHLRVRVADHAQLAALLAKLESLPGVERALRA